MEYEGRPIAEIETRRLAAERFRELKDHFRVAKREDWGDLWAATALWVSQCRFAPDSPEWKSYAGYMSEKDALADLARLGKVPRLERRIVKVTVEEVATNAERADK